MALATNMLPPMETGRYFTMTKKTVLTVLQEGQDKISKALEAHQAYKGKESMPQFAMTKTELKNAVVEYITLTTALINDKKIAADPCGVLTGSSLFGEEVDAIIKEEMNIADAEVLAAVIDNAQNASFLGKLAIYTKCGFGLAIDFAKKTVTFIINGVVKVYQWTKLKLTNFKDWVIGLVAKKQPA